MIVLLFRIIYSITKPGPLYYLEDMKIKNGCKGALKIKRARQELAKYTCTLEMVRIKKLEQLVVMCMKILNGADGQRSYHVYAH